MARLVDYRKGRGSKTSTPRMNSCRSGRKIGLGEQAIPKIRKPSYRTLDTKKRRARGSILRDRRARSRNAVPVENQTRRVAYHVWRPSSRNFAFPDRHAHELG